MYTAIVENEQGDRIELTNSPYFDVTEIDGLLPAEAKISETEMAGADGSTLESVKIESRTVTITVLPRFPVEQNRQELYKYFRTKKETKLYFKNENRDVMISGVVQGIEGSLFEQKQTLKITMKCMNPYFRDKYEKMEDMSTVEDMFEFPFAIEEEGIEFSQINKELMKSIYNAGDEETGVIIELSASGTVENPIIYNADTRERFGLNITMEAGDVIRIETNRFNKKVILIRDAQETNIINSIMRGNKWFKLAAGENIFTYTCDSGEEFLNIKFIYQNLYEGV